MASSDTRTLSQPSGGSLWKTYVLLGRGEDDGGSQIHRGGEEDGQSGPHTTISIHNTHTHTEIQRVISQIHITQLTVSHRTSCHVLIKYEWCPSDQVQFVLFYQLLDSEAIHLWPSCLSLRWKMKYRVSKVCFCVSTDTDRCLWWGRESVRGTAGQEKGRSGKRCCTSELGRGLCDHLVPQESKHTHTKK